MGRRDSDSLRDGDRELAIRDFVSSPMQDPAEGFGGCTVAMHSCPSFRLVPRLHLSNSQDVGPEG